MCVDVDRCHRLCSKLAFFHSLCTNLEYTCLQIQYYLISFIISTQNSPTRDISIQSKRTWSSGLKTFTHVICFYAYNHTQYSGTSMNCSQEHVSITYLYS